jgi:multimeric flavodoxin WrbA
VKILALIGSPRRGGNTETLVDALLGAAREHESRKVYLYDHEIRPCVDCRSCKLREPTCVLPDDMPSIYAAVDDADAIVFATPTYWFGPSGTMKLLLDRLRPYVASRRLVGKRAILVAPAGDGPADAALLLDMFRRSAAYLGMVWTGEILATAYDRGDIDRDRTTLQAAAALGARL